MDHSPCALSRRMCAAQGDAALGTQGRHRPSTCRQKHVQTTFILIFKDHDVIVGHYVNFPAIHNNTCGIIVLITKS